MDLSIRHQIRHAECDIKDFTKLVDEFRTKYGLEYWLFVETYFILYKYIYIYLYIYIYIYTIYIYPIPPPLLRSISLTSLLTMFWDIQQELLFISILKKLPNSTEKNLGGDFLVTSLAYNIQMYRSETPPWVFPLELLI